MSMDGTFVAEFRKAVGDPEVRTVNGKDLVFAPPGWLNLTPGIQNIEPLKVHTLSGLVAYVMANIDTVTLGRCVAHVVDPVTVHLRAMLEPEDRAFRRHTYVVATAMPVAFQYGQFMDAETFAIALQTAFVPTEPRERLRTFLAAIKESTVRETADDGVAQRVNVQQGVTLVGTQSVPNPVFLHPYRTFREILQPGSAFVVRLRSNDKGDKPHVALFEADGGAWRLEAIGETGKYLRAALPDDLAIIA